MIGKEQLIESEVLSLLRFFLFPVQLAQFASNNDSVRCVNFAMAMHVRVDISRPMLKGVKWVFGYLHLQRQFKSQSR